MRIFHDDLIPVFSLSNRIVDSLSLNNVLSDVHLNVPSADNCEALSVDSLDLSLEAEEEEINSKLIEKCSAKDKTHYKIAMIESSTHSMLQQSYSSQHSDCDFNSNLNNNANRTYAKTGRDPNHRISELLKLSIDKNGLDGGGGGGPSGHDHVDGASVQSPGTLMKLFMQNKVIENTGLGHNGSAHCNNNNRCDSNYNLINNRHQAELISELDETTTTTNAATVGTGTTIGSPGHSGTPNTVDSAELPLHVLDLSKKMRQMTLNKHQQQQQQQLYSMSMSSNTSYTSTTTTTSSSSTFDQQHPHHHHRNRRSARHRSKNGTNPFLPGGDDPNSRSGKSVCTQFPEKFQDKQVQACFDHGTQQDVAAPPVLVYYPNYSLPDLSFLQDVFRQEHRGGVAQPIYLSPVKHDPGTICEEEPTTEPICSAKKSEAIAAAAVENRRRNHNLGEGPKSRPKSYTDYEALLYQDFSHIKDWDSLNLLLPEDFKEFIERNNLAPPKSGASSEHHHQPPSFPIKATMATPPGGRLPGVRLRPYANHRLTEPDKRYSLQEHTAGNVHHHLERMIAQQHAMDNYPPNYYPRPEMPAHLGAGGADDCGVGGFMTRSQTMPNCGLQYVYQQPLGMPLPPPPGMPMPPSPGYCYGGPPPPPPPNSHHGCCCRSHHSHTQYCHSSCHSPSMHSSSNTTTTSCSPQKPITGFGGCGSGANQLQSGGGGQNLNWDLFSSSTSFKRLVSLLNKLDEFSVASGNEQQQQQQQHNNVEEPNLVGGGLRHQHLQKAVAQPQQQQQQPTSSSAKGPSRANNNDNNKPKAASRVYSSRAAASSAGAAAAGGYHPRLVQQNSKESKQTQPAIAPPPTSARSHYRRPTSVQSKATSPSGPPPPLPARTQRPQRAAATAAVGATTTTTEKTRVILKRPAPASKASNASLGNGTVPGGAPGHAHHNRRTSRIPVPRFGSAAGGGSSGTGHIKEYRTTSAGSHNTRF